MLLKHDVSSTMQYAYDTMQYAYDTMQYAYDTMQYAYDTMQYAYDFMGSEDVIVQYAFIYQFAIYI